SVVPYYNRPCQRGMYAHFKAIAENTGLPMLLYNVPGRTASDLADDTTLALANDFERIIGIKDATGDLVRGQYLLDNRPDDFLVISGDDGTAVELTLMGGQGDISVTANVAPKLMSEVMERALAGERDAAIAINAKLQGLHTGLFVESSPSASKYCLSELGLIGNHLRLPLVPTDPKHYDMLHVAMRQAELI
ncbi:MAG: dihydrodipicolinate synthase family protein, partial [Litorivicinus sp.]